VEGIVLLRRHGLPYFNFPFTLCGAGRHILTSIILLGFVSQVAMAQTSTPSPSQPVRDAQALAVVQQSLTAMGGTAAVSQVQNSVVTAAVVNPTAPEGTTESFTWTYAGNQFRLEDDAANGGHVFVSSGGSPQDFHDGAWFDVSPVMVRTNLPFHVPALALYGEIQNPGYSFIFVGSATLNGSGVIHIQTRDDSDMTGHLFTLQDWYFDPVKELPLRVEYQIPMSLNPSDSLNASMNFSNFQAVTGILIPFQLSIIEGPVSLALTVTSAAFYTTVDSSGFAPSIGAVQ
jgi:hypothetical protein